MTNTRLCELVSNDSFKSVLINELYALIDEEMAKDIDMDCDLVDQLVEAIEQLEKCEDENLAVVIPMIFANGTLLSNRIRNKYNGTKLAYRITAIAAAAAIILSSMNSVPAARGQGESVLVYALNEFVEQVEKVFGVLTKDETPTEEATTEPITEEANENEIEIKDEEPVQKSVELMELELITAEDFKTSYLWRESLDLKGLKIMAIYSDGSSVEIPASDCEITGFNNVKVGEQTVTVKYKDFKETFIVNVSKTEKENVETRQIVDVECSQIRTLLLAEGTENPVNKLQWRYVYSDGTFAEWKYCHLTDGITLVSDYDKQLIDTEQELTYSAPNGMTFTITVLLYENVLEDEKVVWEMSLHSVPKGFHQYSGYSEQYGSFLYEGEDFDINEFKFEIKYKDIKETEIISVGDSDIQVFGPTETAIEGKYSIVFTYGNGKFGFAYDVIERKELVWYEVNQGFWSLYHIDDAPAEYKPTRLVKGMLKGGTEIVFLDIEVRGYDPTKTGFIEVDIYYQGEYLCSTIAGYIYENYSWIVRSRPTTEYFKTDEVFEVSPKLYATYFTEKNQPSKSTDDFMEEYGLLYGDHFDFRMGKEASFLDNAGIYLFSSRGENPIQFQLRPYNFKNPPTKYSDVFYKPLSITECGEYELNYCFYDVLTDENGNFIRGDVAFECSYTITVKEAPSSYKIVATDTVKSLINIKDINEEFYDKLKAYAVYSDGREVETDSYVITRYQPTYPIKAGPLDFTVIFPDMTTQRLLIVAYADGYENSWYMTVENKTVLYKPGSNPYISIDIHFPDEAWYGMGATIRDVETSNSKIIGWDSTTPGKRTATIVYNHSILGEMTGEFEYEIDYYKPKIQVNFVDGYIYDPRIGISSKDYTVFFQDTMGGVYEITDYTVKLNLGTERLNFSYNDPYTNEKVWKNVDLPMIEAPTTVTAKRNKDGTISLNLNNDFAEADNIIYSIQYRDYDSHSLYKYKDTKKSFVLNEHVNSAKKLKVYVNVIFCGNDGDFIVFYKSFEVEVQ